jgi:hypothetical protein
VIGRTWSELGIEPTRIAHPVAADTFALDELTGDTAAMARLILSNTASPQERWRASGELDLQMRQATGVAKAPYVAEFVACSSTPSNGSSSGAGTGPCAASGCNASPSSIPVLYTGTESPNRKAASVAAFKSGQSRVLIMSLRAGAGIDGLQEVCQAHTPGAASRPLVSAASVAGGDFDHLLHAAGAWP